MQKQFDNLTASELYCPRCHVARPVRERLLLILPHSELHDYRCMVCGESCGSREIKAPPISVARIGRAPRQTASPPASQMVPKTHKSPIRGLLK